MEGKGRERRSSSEIKKKYLAKTQRSQSLELFSDVLWYPFKITSTS